MEHVWDALVALFTAFVGVIVWMFKKHAARIDDMEKRITSVEKTAAVIECKIDDIKDDIHEIKDGVNKLIDNA